MFRKFYYQTDTIKANGLYQKHDNRYLIQNPPPAIPVPEELDKTYEMNFENSIHPYYKSFGEVRALDTIQFSVTTHRGCYGECNFCAIAMHQGRTISSRTEESIVREVEGFKSHPDFKGIIRDVGGPTANMYGFECDLKLEKGCCDKKKCIFPNVCKQLKVNHSRQTKLLKKLRNINGIRRVFVASGIRHDTVIADKNNGEDYLKELVCHHVSGQMKLAPEHSEKKILNLMGKPGIESLLKFKKKFDEISKSIGKKQFLTYYLIAAHPGCRIREMENLRGFVNQQLKLTPEQVQIFIPLPSTWSGVMYYTEKNPNSRERIFVEKENRSKEKQKNLITKRVSGTSKRTRYKKRT